MSAAFLWLLSPSFTAGDDGSELMPPRGSSGGSAGDDGAGEPLPHARAWTPDDYAWDAQAMVGAATPASLDGAPSGAGSAAGGGSRREGPRTCEVAGCAQLLSGAVHGKEYNRRYRLCTLHLRCAEVALAGVPSRWCQTCSRFQPVADFVGTKRSCAQQLLALSARRRARAAARRAQARAVAAAAAPCLEETDLLDWLIAGDPSAPPPPEPPGPGRPAALFADLLGAPPPPPAAPLPAPAAPPRAVSIAVKLPHATPAQLPSSLAPALAAWADEPLALFGLAQPGCTLLTVDALLRGDAACHVSAAHAPEARRALAEALRGCAAASDGAMRGADVAIAFEDDDDDNGGRAPPLAARVVELTGPAALTATATFAAPVDAAALRCRAHGTALALMQAGDCCVAVALPPGFAHGLLLFDLVNMPGGGGAPLRLARPRPLLVTRDAAVAAELSAADADDADLLLMGTALHGVSGASDAAPELLAAAATTAARRGWLGALAALLPALEALPREWRRGLLAAAAGGARPDAAVRLLLCVGGPAWAFGAPADGALHAAALACSSRDARRAAAAAAAARALTAHGDGALAWHAAARQLPGGCGGGVWTPAQLAARATGCAPATALCTELNARTAAAHAMLATAAAALPPAVAAPPAAARRALLSAAPRRLAPGTEAEAASEQARVADLATAMLADADAAIAPHDKVVGLRSALRRAGCCASPARRQLSVRLLFSLANLPGLWLLAALLITRRPAASAAEFRAAAAAGAVPLRFWLPSRGIEVAALLRPAAATTAAVCLAPEAAVVALLARSDCVEAALVTFVSAFVLLALQSDALMLPGWRTPGQAPVVWEFAASVVQLLISGSTYLRARAWAPRLAALALAARAGMLLAAAAAAGHAVPLTRHSGAVVALQVALLGLAAARAGAAWAGQSARQAKAG